VYIRNSMKVIAFILDNAEALKNTREFYIVSVLSFTVFVVFAQSLVVFKLCPLNPQECANSGAKNSP